MTWRRHECPRHGLQWDRKPSWQDPRVPFVCILVCYVALGVTVLGFNRSPLQVLLTVAAACALDMALHFVLRGRRLLFPLSAAISGFGLAILVNFAHGPWLPLIPVFFAIASKYAITFRGRHVFNPTLFAVVVCLKLPGGVFSVAPAYQWGGSAAMAAFVVTAALALFVFRIGRNPLIISFLGFYFLELALRAWITRFHVPPETLFLGAVTSASFYLFTFFMITDPQTSPASTRGQVGMSAVIVLVDLILHRFESLSTLFFAGFVWFAGRFLWLHARAIFEGERPRLAEPFRRLAV
ncbi:MAG: FG-GAP-like repeat-containing protein, partial [Longimicrobiales bacterium]